MKSPDPRRGIALFLIAWIVPACTYSRGPSYTPPGGSPAPPGSTVLLSDTFVVFPGSAWSPPTLDNGATAATAFSGADYRLQMAAPVRTGGTAPSAFTRSVTAFDSHVLTISADLGTTAPSTEVDVASVVIESSPARGVLARADLDSSAQTLTFSILGARSAPIAVTPGTLVRVTFQVDPRDQATWRVGDGGPTVAVPFPAQRVDVALEGAWAVGTPASNPLFQFRDVLVATP